MSLKETLSGRQYLVGDAFTRADVTTAAMLMLLKTGSAGVFRLYAGTCGSSTSTRSADDPAFAAVFAWRDQMYKKHRGEAVRP